MRPTTTSVVTATTAVLVALVALVGLAPDWSSGGTGTASAGRRVPRPSGPTSPTSPTAPAPSATTLQATVTPPTRPGPSSAEVWRAVTDAVDAAARRGIRQDVVVADRRTGRPVLAVRADVPVPAMSLVKLFFAVDVLDTAGGPDRVAPATLARLHRMIATSDDTLASAFYLAGGEGRIIERVAARYHLPGTRPSPKPRYWGDIQTTAADLVSFLAQALADSDTGPFLADAMLATTDAAADGLDQDFGMNAVPGAGSKQGWGCCLGGVVALHSVGFTPDRIVVVLSTAAPDTPGLSDAGPREFTADPGFRASVAAVTETARAAAAPSGSAVPSPASPHGTLPPVAPAPTPAAARAD